MKIKHFLSEEKLKKDKPPLKKLSKAEIRNILDDGWTTRRLKNELKRELSREQVRAHKLREKILDINQIPAELRKNKGSFPRAVRVIAKEVKDENK